MKKWMKLRDTIPTPQFKGIFFNLASSEEFEYINDDNKKTLNIDYYDIYSREKLASQYFINNIDSDYVIVDTDDLVLVGSNDYAVVDTTYDDLYDKLSDIIINRFKDKWDRIYAVLVEKEYEALDNYNMEEVRTPNLTFQKTLNVEDKRTLDLKDERTLDLTDEKTLDLNDTTNTKTKIDTTSVVDTNRFGFNDNSGSGSPYEKATTHNTASPLDNQVDTTLDRTGTDTDTHTGTDTLEQSGTDTMKHTGTDTDTHTGTEKLTRRGNIGVTTSQQMLESEIRLRALYNMVTIIYNDIDKVLTSPIYL